jgi:hypothetical protein
MRRYILCVMVLICIGFALSGCSRFARVTGMKYQGAHPEVIVVAGSRLETGPLTLEAGSGLRWGEEPVPVTEVGGTLKGRGWSATMSMMADVGDIRETYILFITAETDL